VHDHPHFAFAAKDQHQPRHFSRQLVPAAGEMDVEEGRRHHHVGAEVLQREIEHFHADAARYLGKVLAGDADPLVTVVDQPGSAAGVAAEVLAETRGEAVIARGVHLDVLVKQCADLALAIWVHGDENPGGREHPRATSIARLGSTP
jgi:hypothetical protein